jgi:serine/threonine-protein phosphatase 2A regulatory subunit A
VRLAIIEYVPLLASQLGVKFFDEKLSSLCMSWLGDTVFSIREASTQNLKKLTEVLGVEWANEAIVPKVMAMGQHPNYLYRMTTCFAVSVSLCSILCDSTSNLIQTLAPALSLDVIEASILPMMDKLVNDDIPNIRFNVAKSYAVLVDTLKQLPEEGTVLGLIKAGTPGQGCQKAHELITKNVLPNLEKLQQDDDVDVRYFATTAAQGYTDVMQT